MSATAGTIPQTAAGRHLRLAQKISSFPAMLGSLLIMLAVMTDRERFNDPDMWWHLRMGQLIWSNHAVPTTDLFSYTTNRHATVPHEWLSQLSIYAAERLGGFPGLMLWFCLMSAAILIAGYAYCTVYTGNPKIGFLSALGIWFFSTVGQSIRPQMVGYFFLLIELLVIQLGRTKTRRWFFALPPLFLLWINCHSSFFLGLVVAGVFLLGSFTSFSSGLLLSPAWNPKARRTLAWSLGITIILLLLTPFGPKQILYPIDTLLHQPIGLSMVEEWRPLQITDARAFALVAVLACVAAVIVLRRFVLLWDELLLIFLGTWLAVSHQRMLFVFGILVIPGLARLLSDLWDGTRVEKQHPWLNVTLIAASLFLSIRAFPSQSNLAAQVEKGNPVGAVQFINTHQMTGRMLNEYVYGGYLIWAAPRHPVFIDGRADVFEWTGVFAQFQRWETLQEDPRLLLTANRIDFCLLAKQSPMMTVMSLLPAWRIAYQDDKSVVFTRALDSEMSGSFR